MFRLSAAWSFHRKDLERLKTYPEKFRNFVVDEIEEFKTEIMCGNAEACPSVSTGSGSYHLAPGPWVPVGGSGCIACPDDVRLDSPSHDRFRGRRRYPNAIPIYRNCKACKNIVGRNNGHNEIPGECRFATLVTLPGKEPAPVPVAPPVRAPPPRSVAHPVEPGRR